jgi:transposase
MYRTISGAVSEILDQNPFAKGSQVKTLLSERGIKASESTICRARRAAGYSRKRARARYIPREPTVEAASEYLSKLESAREALAIDETCIYIEDAPRFGYSRRGIPCIYRRKYSPRSKKVTLLMAISERRGIVSKIVIKGSVNSSVFASFILGLDTNEGCIAVLDNVSFHKTREVREAALRKGIDLLFIPPYSPEFNPIEGTFSVLKAALRSGQRTDLETALQTVTVSKCEAFFRNSKRTANNIVCGQV